MTVADSLRNSVEASVRGLFDQEIFTEPEEIRQSSNVWYVAMPLHVYVSNRSQTDVRYNIQIFIFSTFIRRFLLPNTTYLFIYNYASS